MNGSLPRCARLLAAWLLLCLPPVAAAGSARLAEIESTMRGRPAVAIAELNDLLRQSHGVLRVEALVLLGYMQARLADGAEVDLEPDPASPA